LQQQAAKVGMAMTVVDPEFERHRQTWIGFTRLLKWSAAVIVLILIGMAIFLA
jgi:hypothetical protein